jgi:hypothetical protein
VQSSPLFKGGRAIPQRHWRVQMSAAINPAHVWIKPKSHPWLARPPWQVDRTGPAGRSRGDAGLAHAVRGQTTYVVLGQRESVGLRRLASVDTNVAVPACETIPRDPGIPPGRRDGPSNVPTPTVEKRAIEEGPRGTKPRRPDGRSKGELNVGGAERRPSRPPAHGPDPDVRERQLCGVTMRTTGFRRCDQRVRPAVDPLLSRRRVEGSYARAAVLRVRWANSRTWRWMSVVTVSYAA